MILKDGEFVRALCPLLKIDPTPSDWPDRDWHTTPFTGAYGPAGVVLALEGSPVRLLILVLIGGNESDPHARIFFSGKMLKAGATAFYARVHQERWAVIRDFLKRHGLWGTTR